MGKKQSKINKHKDEISEKMRYVQTAHKRVHVIPIKNRWVIKREGKQRADKIVVGKNTAISEAKKMAIKYSADAVLIHQKDGTIGKMIKTKNREEHVAAAG